MAYMIVADDDPDDRLLLQEALGEVGFSLQVLFMEDGSEVIGHLAVCDTLPKMAIMDINMPKVTGVEVLEFLRARPLCAGIPVHILSSSTLQKDEERCLALGAKSFTTKPGNYRQLVNWLTTLKNNL